MPPKRLKQKGNKKRRQQLELVRSFFSFSQPLLAASSFCFSLAFSPSAVLIAINSVGLPPCLLRSSPLFGVFFLDGTQSKCGSHA
jgi:hypothetical protein